MPRKAASAEVASLKVVLTAIARLFFPMGGGERKGRLLTIFL